MTALIFENVWQIKDLGAGFSDVWQTKELRDSWKWTGEERGAGEASDGEPTNTLWMIAQE
jgi:hypothetical protein